MSLEYVKTNVESLLNKISSFFKPGAKLTLLVRAPENDDADFLMTNDQPQDIRAALDRRFGSSLSQGSRDVLAERARQISQEDWTIEHDDEHDPGVLAAAASCYTMHAADVLYPYSQGDGGWAETPPPGWLWDYIYWKPTTPRRDLIKAGALILAEIEKIDRAEMKNQRDQESPKPGTCQKCGCTDANCTGCVERTGLPCYWVNKEQTLCSACSPKLVQS